MTWAHPPRTVKVLITLLVLGLLAGCTGSTGSGTTAAPTTLPSSPTTTLPTTTSTTLADWDSPEVCDGCAPEMVAVIPVGPEGVTYENLDVSEMEAWGPAGMVGLDEGGWAVLDSAGLGIVIVQGDEVSRIELEWEGMVSLLDLATAELGFWVLDVPATNVARVVLVSSSGAVLEAFDLPLTPLGLLNDPAGGLWFEEGGSSRIGVVDPATGSVEMHSGYPYPHGLYSATYNRQRPERVTFHAPNVDIVMEGPETSTMGVRLLGVNPDRSFVVEVSELTQDDQGVLQVDLTSRWYAADGEPLGVAPLPLEEQLVHVPHPAVVGDDGYVYYLLTRREQVEVLRLPWKTP